MKTENAVLMTMARESLKEKWGVAIGTFLIYGLITSSIQMPRFFFPDAFIFFPSSILISLIIGGPMLLGAATFSLALGRNQHAEIGDLFKGFNNFGTSVFAYLLMSLFILLWTILLIVPGIIAALSYSMTFFIIVDEPSIDAMEAIKKSKQIMIGYKWKLFKLYLRFLGWALLCILTLGIGFLWLMPYIHVSMAKFYDDIKKNQIEKIG